MSSPPSPDGHPFSDRSRSNSPQEGGTHAANSRTTDLSVAEYFQNVVATHFLTPDQRRWFKQESNRRLDEARSLNLPLEWISLDEDALPTWAGRTSNATHLLDAVREAIVTHENVRAIGPLILEHIKFIGGWRLRQAVQQGISLGDIYVDNTLLPRWNRPLDYETSSVRQPSRSPEVRSEVSLAAMGLVDAGPARSTGSLGSTASTGNTGSPGNTGSTGSTQSHDPPLSHATAPAPVPSGMLHTFFRNYSSMSVLDMSDDSSSVSSEGSERDIFDGAFMPNLGDGYTFGPIDLATNFVGYDVAHQEEVHFQIHAAEDEDEVRDMPELELLVNEEAFMAHFEPDEIMEIDLDHDIRIVEHPNSPSVTVGRSEDGSEYGSEDGSEDELEDDEFDLDEFNDDSQEPNSHTQVD